MESNVEFCENIAKKVMRDPGIISKLTYPAEYDLCYIFLSESLLALTLTGVKFEINPNNWDNIFTTYAANMFYSVWMPVIHSVLGDKQKVEDLLMEIRMKSAEPLIIKTDGLENDVVNGVMADSEDLLIIKNNNSNND